MKEWAKYGIMSLSGDAYRAALRQVLAPREANQLGVHVTTCFLTPVEEQISFRFKIELFHNDSSAQLASTTLTKEEYI